MNGFLVALIWAGILIIPYLLGSINTGIIVSRIGFKDDVRTHGSGNAGMTNVLRTYGKLPALITLLGDFGKSVLAVYIARWLFQILADMGYTFFGLPDFDGAYIGGLCALLGHIYPVFFKFRGGKGVMTCCGILAVVQPVALTIGIVIFVITVLCTRYVSLGSILGAISYPIAVGFINSAHDRPIRWEVLFSVIYALIVILKHKENIVRLIKGKENKISLRKKPAAPGPESGQEEKNK